MSIGRTMFSGSAGENLSALPDPYERPSDALDSPGLWSLDLCPEWSKSTAPFGLFLLGLIMLAASIYYAAI